MKTPERNISKLHKTKRTLIRLFTFFALFIWAAGCSDTPFSPKGENQPPKIDSELGLVKVTISGIGTDKMSASAYSVSSQTAYNLTEPAGTGGGDGTIQIEAVSNGSFTYGERGSGGVRYVFATFKVRNAQSDGTAYDTPRQNLTFLAVDNASTIGETAVVALRKFNGDPITGTQATSLSDAVKPTGLATLAPGGSVTAIRPDVLQVLTETEAAGITVDPGVNVFPYGFITRSPGVNPGSRTLPASPATNQYDGMVTFAVTIPLSAQANDDPFEITMLFLPVDDSETRITQSPQEQTPEGEAALLQRANELAAGSAPVSVTLLGNSSSVIPGFSLRRICEVRTAGTASVPIATMGLGAPCLPGDALPSNVRAVDIDATGANNGTTWANAFTTLQDALACVRDNAAPSEACEGVDELWLAEGVYYPDEGTGFTDNDETASFSLVEGIEIYGGFAGSEYRRDLRNFETNLSILSGDIEQNDSNPDGDFIADNTNVIAEANSNNVTSAGAAGGMNITRATVVDGITITAGHSANGAGLLCDVSGAVSECSPVLRNVIFSGNEGKVGAGVAIVVENGGNASPLFKHVVFTGNRANRSAAYGGAGAAIGITGSGTVTPDFVDVLFKNNDGSLGGGLVLFDGVENNGSGFMVDLYNVRFIANSATNGGAIYNAAKDEISIRVVNAVFLQNTVTGTIGKASAIWLGDQSPVDFVMINATVVGNSGGSEVIRADSADVTIYNSIFWDNVPASIRIANSSSSITIIENSILEGGCAGILSSPSCASINVIDQDPLFIDGIAPGFDVRLQGLSPAIDAGNNASLPASDPFDIDGDGNTAERLPIDIAGNPRVVNASGVSTAIVDMGVYEDQ